MRQLSKIFGRIALATGLTAAAWMGLGTEQAHAQYPNDPYSNYGYNDDYNYNPYSTDYLAFYHELAPHGQWYRDPRWGMVWVPRVANGFVPYQTNGYWAMTQYGNTWMSSYAWGWAAFHYGRWAYDPMIGWIWIPGRVWGPAWVLWRQGGGYYGWAPLGPSLHIHMSYNNHVGFNCWTFVPRAKIYYTGGYNRYMRNVNVYNVYNNTTVINNYDRSGGRNYILGPSRGDVESAVRKPVKVYRLEDGNSRGAASVRGNNISMYRPDVQSAARSAKPVDIKNVRTIEASSRIVNESGSRSTSPATNTNRNTTSPATQQRNSMSVDRNVNTSGGQRTNVQDRNANQPSRNTTRPAQQPASNSQRVAPRQSNTPQRQATPSSSTNRSGSSSSTRQVQSAPSRTSTATKRSSNSSSSSRSTTTQRSATTTNR